MPFARPSLDDLRSQAAADLAAALPGANPLLPVSNLGILADLEAEGFNGNYGYLDYIARQSVPFTALGEAFLGWAALKGAAPKDATFAQGQATFPGSVGTPLPAGTPVTRGADGFTYQTTAAAVVGGGGTVTAPIVALTAGAAGTLVGGSVLVLGTGIPNIGSSGVATAGALGVDAESFPDFKTRVLGIFAAPPQGGAIADYIEWAGQVPGVTRAWCTPNGNGPGTVIVYFMMDLAEAAHGGFPQGANGVASAETRDVAATGDQLLVANWIYPLRPVTALVYADAPGANTVTFTISLPGATAPVKAAISAAIDAALLAYGAPGGTVNLSRLETAIGAISGTDGFVITAEACNHGTITPTAGNIISAAGYLPVRGAITWI
jgi:uncharacterized phage protein gp47/JayE